MRKMIGVVAMVFVGLVFLAGSANAEEYLAKKTFVGQGTFQRYIPFQFEVPAGNCGNLEVWQFAPGYYPNFTARWERKYPGDLAGFGVCRFKNTESQCATRFTITGIEFSLMETWSMMEVEPKNIGLLKGGWKEGNTFGLEEDDREASYYLLHPNYGMNTNLTTIVNEMEFIFYHGRLAGVIIADSRGFLKKYVTGDQLDRQLKNIWLDDDDVVILEFRDEY